MDKNEIILNRVDNEPPVTTRVTIPSGVYYFSQEGCESCKSENELLELIQPFFQKAGIKLNLQYINLSKMKNPTNIQIIGTPTLVDSENGKLYVSSGGWLAEYLIYRFGSKRYSELSDCIQKENKQKRMLEIKEHISNGLKYKKLVGMGFDKEEVNICFGKPAKKQEEEEDIDSNCEDGACILL